MKVSRRQFIQTGALAAAAAAVAGVVGFERYFLETNEFFLGGTTEDSGSLKIVQISDLHLRSIKYPHKHLANKLNKLKPDLIAFTGDSIDRHGKLWVLEHFLKLIDKSIPKVAILGNWEYWSTLDFNDLRQLYADYNCKLLVNQSTRFNFQNKTLLVTGLDDFVGGSPDIVKAFNEYTKSDYHLVLSHCPQYSDVISEKLSKDIEVDFILSGHTHGGQITMFGLAPLLPTGSGRYLKGWYNDRTPKMYVSKGIGTTMLPVRFGARAEVAIFHLAV